MKLFFLFWVLAPIAWGVTPSKGEAWLRLNSQIEQSKIDQKGNFLAYVDKQGTSLRIANLNSKDIYLVSEEFVGSSFFWSPDNKRLIYTKTLGDAKKPRTDLYAFDLGNKTNIKIESLEGQAGTLSFDPRDNQFFLMHGNGVISKKIEIPDSRLAKWQARIQGMTGRFVASPNAITYVTNRGNKLEKLLDDNSGVESFDISPDGSSIVWSTVDGRIYASKHGKISNFLDYGRDPKWHPAKELIVYSGSHMIGTKAAGYNIKITNLSGESTWLTNDSYLNQRWPVWVPGQGKVIYTKAETTDLYMLELKK
jgi:dipeptidyl aminopeptidase/acylaminoacyl peptidase